MLTWNPLIATHALAAGLAVPIGAVALLARPGGRVHRLVGPRLHKALGYAWVALMLTAALTGAFIRDFGLPNINGYTPIHILVVVTLVSVPLAVWFAMTKRFEAHRRTMLNTYWGACILAGAFTLLPNRLMGRWLWHDTLGVTPANLGMAQGILKATPMWVWVLLVVLLSVGVQQLRRRTASLPRALAFPSVMLAFALFGLVTGFGAGLPLLVWALALGALLPLLARLPMTRGATWDSWKEQFTLPGSAVPLGIIVVVFGLKYTVGVKLGFNPALAQDLGFTVPVAALYGAINALLLARAWQLWRLAHPARTPQALPAV
jgi:uncharacterized membrane protein